MSCDVIQGDCFEELGHLPGEAPNMVLADPPFNLGKDYGGGVDDRLSPERYAEWLFSFYRLSWAVCAADAVLYAFCAPDQIPLARRVIEAAGWQFCQQLIWYGPNGSARRGRGRPEYALWGMFFEPIIYARKGTGLRGVSVMPWYHGVIVVPRPQSNFAAGRFHVCQKPVRLYSILVAAHQGIVRVLDPACGSGSSLVACVELGIPAVGIEIVPESAELSRKRVEAAKVSLQYRLARGGQKGLFVPMA